MLKRSLVLAALCGMSFAATAVTIDLRHEFIDGGKSDKSNGYQWFFSPQKEFRQKNSQSFC